MSVYAGRGNLAKAMQDLMARWLQTRDEWSDAMSDEFQNTYLEPLQPKIKNAVGAMNEMAELLHRIHRDCE